MFDKTIKIEINRCPVTLTNEEVKALVLGRQDYQALQAKHDDVARRLELANRKLKEYGHVSGF